MEINKSGDFGTMCVCAIRYSLGRKTYMPSLMTEFIKANWANLDDNTKAVIMKDVRRAIKDDLSGFNSLGHECDRIVWTKFGRWMRNGGSQTESQDSGSGSEA